jgi:hypothetical protein
VRCVAGEERAGERRWTGPGLADTSCTGEAVDELCVQTIDDGLYVTVDEQRFVVTDTFESGPELVETVSAWQGTRNFARARRTGRGGPPAGVRVSGGAAAPLTRAT